MAWAMFGETLTGLSLVGMVVAVLGVWLARGKQSAKRRFAEVSMSKGLHFRSYG